MLAFFAWIFRPPFHVFETFENILPLSMLEVSVVLAPSPSGASPTCRQHWHTCSLLEWLCSCMLHELGAMLKLRLAFCFTFCRQERCRVGENRSALGITIRCNFLRQLWRTFVVCSVYAIGEATWTLLFSRSKLKH